MLQSRATAIRQPIRSLSATTNKPLRRANGNTAAGRRIRDLYRAFLEHMGNPLDAIAQANALKAAELTAASENARSKLLAGEGDIEQIVRLENLAARAVKRLGIKVADHRQGPTLAEYLASKAAAGGDRDGAGP